MSINLLNAHCAIGVTSFGTSCSGAFLIHKPDFGLVELPLAMAGLGLYVGGLMAVVLDLCVRREPSSIELMKMPLLWFLVGDY